MNIAGLQKMTLLDFPGKVACTVFLQGCNFRCPFCHNGEILDGSADPFLTADELLEFLSKRKGLLDGVCITGGEPTLQPDLPELLDAIKALGFAVKLDTNGNRPDVLQSLLSKGLVDYVAMDIKNSPQLYGQTVGIPNFSVDKISQSVQILMTGATAYEFRTTVVSEYHSEESFRQIGAWLQDLVPNTKVSRFYLQPFADRDTVLKAGLHAPNAEELQRFLQVLKTFSDVAEIRGQD